MIPAMDAVRSKRFGYIETDDVQITIILHDKDVENRNHGEAWQRPSPIFVKGDSSVDVASIVENAEDYDKESFSNGFWEETAKVYRIVSPDYEDSGEDTRIDYDRLDNKFEVEFLSNIVHVLNNEGVSHQIWSNVLEDAQWNRIDDCETGDVNLFGDEQGSFVESNFESTEYVPNPEEVEKWGLYAYNWEFEGRNVESLWVRFKGTNGTVKVYPLVESLDGLGSIVSTDPDFGSIESNHISESLQKALENIGTMEDEVDNRMVSAVQSASLSDTTADYIGRATESEEIQKED